MEPPVENSAVLEVTTSDSETPAPPVGPDSAASAVVESVVLETSGGGFAHWSLTAEGELIGRVVRASEPVESRATPPDWLVAAFAKLGWPYQTSPDSVASSIDESAPGSTPPDGSGSSLIVMLRRTGAPLAGGSAGMWATRLPSPAGSADVRAAWEAVASRGGVLKVVSIDAPVVVHVPTEDASALFRPEMLADPAMSELFAERSAALG